MTQNTTHTSTWSRRAQYGSISAVLILAVLVIVVVANWLAVDKAQRLRLDLTATRAYSLSPQTRKILESLDTDVRIVTLFAESVSPNPETVRRMNNFSELLDAYQHWGDQHVEVRHIDPSVHTDAFEAFSQELRGHYSDQIKPARQAIDQARGLFDAIEAFGQEQSAQFNAKVPQFNRLDPQQIEFLRQATDVLSQLQTTLNLQARRQELSQQMRHTLPDVEQAVQTVRQPLNSLKAGLLDPAVERLQTLSESQAAGSEARDFATGALRAFREMREQVDAALSKLDAVEADDYAATRRNILEANSVVVMTGDRLTTIRLDSVYTDPMRTQGDQAAPEQRFRGEQAVTGAIISLTLDTPPLVVIVNGTQRPATGQRGTHSHVAERLTNMNFEVEEWNPSGRRTQFGQMPAGPKPEPKPGQKRVWVFLPPPPANPMNPQQNTTRAVMETLNEALEAGDPVMVFLGLSPMSRFGQADPLAAALEPYGIDAQTGELVITSVLDNRGQRFPSRQHLISRFPADHPITDALQGQTVNVQMGLPIELTEPNAPNGGEVTTTPLLRTPEDTWAETDWDQRRELPERNEDEQAGPITVAAAAQQGEQRVIAISDADFASDQYVLRREMAITPDGQLESIERVRFAGNAELFVNGVYWLAGLDNLIATGARTQDVRRFEPISEDQMAAVWWIVMGAVPVACLLVGGVVWLVRRK